MTGKLYCIRHGQSAWNQLNLFTGWVDVSLSSLGIEEAKKVGQSIMHVAFDRVYTSTLIRAELSAMLILEQNRHKKIPYIVHDASEANFHIYDESAKKNLIPVYRNAALNERMYGQLQGMNKDQARKEFGEKQVERWRRSYSEAPPKGESLKMTKERTIPYFTQEILPAIKNHETVLIVAHGNSLRSIVMEILQLSEDEILKFEIATGEPLYFEYENKEWIRKTL